MHKIIFEINYNTNPEKRKGYLATIVELRAKIIETGIDYSVFESKKSPNNFTEMYMCKNEDEYESTLSIAKELLKINRFLYVGFMCHQTIEKILKAKHVAKFPSDTPPYTHNLVKLAQTTGLYELMSLDQKKVIANLEPLNIEARYPSKKKGNFIYT